MGKDLLEHPISRKVFEEADEVIGERLSRTMMQGPLETLQQTAIAQPAILCHSIAIYKVLEHSGVFQDQQNRCVGMMGHSVGEFAALVAAGALSFADAIKITRTRGWAMQEALQKTSLTIHDIEMGAFKLKEGVSRDDLRRELENIQNQLGAQVADMANINSSSQMVLSGTKKGLKMAGEQLSAQGFVGRKMVPLKVSAPFHSRLMASAAPLLAEALETVSLVLPAVPVVSNVTAQKVKIQ